MKPMLVARGRFGATMLDGKLYACGGSNGQVELKSVECFDPVTDTWTQLPDMTSHRTSAG
jgi:Kelch motif